MNHLGQSLVQWVIQLYVVLLIHLYSTKSSCLIRRDSPCTYFLEIKIVYYQLLFNKPCWSRIKKNIFTLSNLNQFSVSSEIHLILYQVGILRIFYIVQYTKWSFNYCNKINTSVDNCFFVDIYSSTFWFVRIK